MTPPLCLPTSATAGAVYVALIVAGVALGLLVSARIWPWTRCPRCGGSGRFRSPTGRAWRKCRRCRGTGERIRPGRRIQDRRG